MQKLSKTQAEWLLGKLKKAQISNPYSKGIFGNVGYAFDADGVFEIINDCTEKEFPFGWQQRMAMRTGMHNKVHHHLHFEAADDGNDILYLKQTASDEEEIIEAFYFNEFKEFVAGCNKIVQWLDEQNDE